MWKGGLTRREKQKKYVCTDMQMFTCACLSVSQHNAEKLQDTDNNNSSRYVKRQIVSLNNQCLLFFFIKRFMALLHTSLSKSLF